MKEPDLEHLVSKLSERILFRAALQSWQSTQSSQSSQSFQSLESSQSSQAAFNPIVHNKFLRHKSIHESFMFIIFQSVTNSHEPNTSSSSSQRLNVI
jgi:hypothetical protein